MGICGIGNAADFGRIGKQMVTRFMLFTLLGSAAAALLARPFFTLAGRGSGGESQLVSIRDLLLNILPSNPVRPFYDGNTLQIIFMAAMLGVLLVSAGPSGTRVRELASDLSDIVTEAIRIVCRLLPLFIFASFSLQIWESGIKTLIGLWKPIVLCAAVCAIFLIVKLSFVCFRLKVNPVLLLKKIFPSMVVGFSTASGSAAFSLCSEVNEKELGIDPTLTRIGYPIGSSIYSVCIAVLYVMTAYTTGEIYGIGGNIRLDADALDRLHSRELCSPSCHRRVHGLCRDSDQTTGISRGSNGDRRSPVPDPGFCRDRIRPRTPPPGTDPAG